MSDKPKKPDSTDDIEQLIDEAHQKLEIEVDYLREISPEEIKYLLDHCPFLQMVDTKVLPEGESKFEIIRAKTNWDIHSYGDAMSSSPGRLLFGGGYYVWSDTDDEGGGGGDLINPGQGTIVNQAFSTAKEMVDLAVQQKWAGIKLVDGHPLMLRSAWIRSNQVGLSLEGFTPDHYDEIIRNRVTLSDTDFEVLRRDIKRRRGMEP
ncbi:MAG: hypothetical protein K0U12_06185 [Gammaproteobacteria bacterium]|nr:hypothetical protein [Gammaproteobacteria bacterium]